MQSESQPRFARLTDEQLRAAAVGLVRALQDEDRRRILDAFAGELDRARAEVRRARDARARRPAAGRPGVNRLAKRGTSDEAPYTVDAAGYFRRADVAADRAASADQ
jgi:hypothetical protein